LTALRTELQKTEETIKQTQDSITEKQSQLDRFITINDKYAAEINNASTKIAAKQAEKE